MKKKIYYGNLIIDVKGKNKKLIDVVFKEGNELYKGNKIVEYEPIKVIGYENINKGHHNANKNEEQRNNITGAYEWNNIQNY